MEKAQKYRGIEFIRISDLPSVQKESINEWLTQEVIIKILKDDDQLLSDCIQYKHYTEWFSKVFSVASVTAEEKTPVNKKSSKIRLALGR